MKNELEHGKTIEEVEGLLKSIFFKFIEFNGKYLTEE
jgi:predicted RNase H-like HicB family nuclease